MKNRRSTNAVDYWDSLADAMLAMFLCILLIVLLFVLYFVQLPPDNGHIDDDPGFGAGYYIEPTPSPEATRFDGWYDDPGCGDDWHQEVTQTQGGGGEGGRDEHRPEVETSPTPTPTMLPENTGEKSAVLVEVVDGETLLPIAKEGIKFELYDARMRLQTLSDYYPIRAEYVNYETTEFGNFYLPEKIHEGDYLLRSLNDVEGYGSAQDTSFSIDSYYDWDDPFIVTVKIYPLRSVIRIRLEDRNTGEGLGGASFLVVAAENIVTLDGTVRLRAGETAYTIVTDVNGYGESCELYFGNYLLRQETVPEYYGIISHDVRTELREKSAADGEVTEIIRAEKTSMRINVHDALYDNIVVPNAVFTVTDADGIEQTFVTDTVGQIFLTNLRKNTSYRIKQTEPSADYRMDPAEHSFTVDGNGLIRGLMHQEMVLENRMIRATFMVTGTLLGNRVSDIRIVLVDRQGETVQQWATSGQDVMISGLAPGSYRLIIGGDVNSPVDVYVADQASIQVFRYTRWTMSDTAIAAGAGAVLLGILVITFITIKRRRARSQRGTNKT